MKNNKKTRKSFKELWSNTTTNALIRLGLWAIFFIIVYIFIILSNVSNGSKPKSSFTTTTKETTTNKITYIDMKEKLTNNSQLIIYKINEYYITGTITNNTLIGTLEDNDKIYKFKYDGGKIFTLKKEEEIENTEILNNIKKEYLLPKNILNIINNPKLIGIKSADGQDYSYNNESISITVHIEKDNIERIIIVENDINYNLEFKEVINES